MHAIEQSRTCAHLAWNLFFVDICAGDSVFAAAAPFHRHFVATYSCDGRVVFFPAIVFGFDDIVYLALIGIYGDACRTCTFAGENMPEYMSLLFERLYRAATSM